VNTLEHPGAGVPVVLDTHIGVLRTRQYIPGDAGRTVIGGGPAEHDRRPG
jgi:hypothetical protein